MRWQGALAALAIFGPVTAASPSLSVRVAINTPPTSGVCNATLVSPVVNITCVPPTPPETATRPEAPPNQELQPPLPPVAQPSLPAPSPPFVAAPQPLSPVVVTAPPTPAPSAPVHAAAKPTTLLSSAFWMAVASDTPPVELYRYSADIIGYRSVSTDKGSYVEFTIVW